MSGKSPIQWREWGPSAFQEAVAADKPILLRLSAVWCHWCHVMDNTSDKDARAIQLLNERFVPIRVDIDRMPDVRERYNFGGYPTSAFLTPTGDILTGGTYIPPDQFVELLDAVANAYKTRKDEILKQIADHRAHHRPRIPAPADDAQKAADGLVEDTLAAALALYDPKNGGFGSQPKFPHGAATVLAIRAFQDTGRKEFETVARGTLEAMRNAALWDQEELGFFRYSVTPDWSEPHYEKMLETNAALLDAYAAGASIGRQSDRDTLTKMRTYLETVLRDAATGLFYGSQDADEDYYALPLAARRTRTAPYVDRTHFSDWNAQMVSAYCSAYRATGDPSWLLEAKRTMDSLLRLAFVNKDGMLHFVREGRAERSGLFGDQVHSARALIDLFELTGTKTYLTTAQRLVEISKASLWNEERGAFNDAAPHDTPLGLLSVPQTNIVDNGVMAQVLVRLARIEQRADPALARLIAAHANAGESSGIFASELALACLDWRRAPLEVHVTGTPKDVVAAVEEAARIRYANVVLVRTDRGEDLSSRGLPAAKPGTVFFCAGNACSRLYNVGEPFAADAERLARGATTTVSDPRTPN